jgi:hypothetical protein
MTFYLNNKRITKQEAAATAGSERFKTILEEAREDHADDPFTEISYMVSGGILSIEF